ncbi:tripartite tricarboxylate transporter TctB family protein [Aidingimonas lacisalsi]|uniref:tripartite tricarboxylate transporter TctB family protein n=1 Tax=Aidingimonas lacisalsi TaxID=2604086 RepID=UPI0011D29186|nr:tripartite tricarboxylate transporter TctB family protein [Aidingimonas lacisalsi]
MSHYKNSVNKATTRVFPLLLLGVSVAYLVSAILLDEPITNGRLSASFFPLIVGAGSTILALILLYRSAVSSADPTKDEASSSDAHRPLWVIAATLAYIVAFTSLGYFVASTLYVFAIILLFSDRTHLLGKALIAMVITIFGFLLFEQIFRVRLPTLWG